MATETVLNKLTINSVPNREVYKAMQEKGLIKQDELYLVDGDGAGEDYIANPAGGKAGQVLTKTTDGTEWKDAPADGDMRTSVYDQQGKRKDVFKYVDDAISKIPTPDVSAQIKAYNESQDAHPYIRGLIPTKTSQLENDSGYLTQHQDISGKLDKSGDGSNVTVAFSTLDKLNLVSGDSLSRLMGKISAWLKDLGKLAFKNTVDKSDLASDVQTSLGKADSALQSAPVTSVNSKTGAVSLVKGDVGLGNVDNVKQYSASNPPPYPVTSVNGKTGAVTVETSSGTTYNATLSSSGWTTSGSYKKQTVTVAGLMANYPVAPVVDAQLTGTDADGDTAVLTGFSAINLIQTAANQLIAYCIGDAPTVNIPLIINTWG